MLAIDVDGRIDFWTSGGSAKLPMAAQVHGTVATGPLGLVSFGDGQVLVSRDGIDYKVSPIPAQMAGANTEEGNRPSPSVTGPSWSSSGPRLTSSP